MALSKFLRFIEGLDLGEKHFYIILLEAVRKVMKLNMKLLGMKTFEEI